MNTNAKFFLAGLIGLVIGVGGTSFVLHERKDSDGGHYMADGTMMREPMGMHDEMNGMMRALDGKTGDSFDRAFLEEMIIHHQGAVSMAEAALRSAEHQEIRDLAQGIITAQNAEIKQMQGWQAIWYGQ